MKCECGMEHVEGPILCSNCEETVGYVVPEDHDIELIAKVLNIVDDFYNSIADKKRDIEIGDNDLDTVLGGSFMFAMSTLNKLRNQIMKLELKKGIDK